MKKNLIALASVTLSFSAHALVSSPATVSEGQWNFEVKTILERGKIEPNGNTDSFQQAEINIYQLSLAKGIGSLGFGSDHFALSNTAVISIFCTTATCTPFTRDMLMSARSR